MRVVIALGVIGLCLPTPIAPEPATGEEMRQAADRFLSALASSRRSKATFPFDHERKTTFMYVPGDRPGVSWADMSGDEQHAAKALLEASLSEAGYGKIDTIRKLEIPLREAEGGNLSRDPDKYMFMFFGSPDAQRPWAWRYEGHHLSLTFAIEGRRVVATTPQFLGSNPAEVRSGPMKGTRVLAKEQDLAFAFMEGLSAQRQREATLASEAPADITVGTTRRAAIQDRLGVRYSSLGMDDRARLMALIDAHADLLRDAEKKARLDAVRRQLDDVVFGWMGPVARGGRHYYRIQGRDFIIEYDNTQTDGNHIHTVWRDLKSDYGVEPDALEAHYHRGHRHR